MPIPTEKNCPSISTTALFAAAHAAVGFGLGLLASNRLDRRTRQTVAIAGLGVGLLATIPLLVELVSQQTHGPESERGVRNRLRSIREDSGFPSDEEIV